MWVVYCTLVEIWVKDKADNGKLTYTTNCVEAKTFLSEELALAWLRKLPYVWRVNCEVMKYTESTQRHNRYFAEQDKYFQTKSCCGGK